VAAGRTPARQGFRRRRGRCSCDSPATMRSEDEADEGGGEVGGGGVARGGRREAG
jgi:hypothetical protein